MNALVSFGWSDDLAQHFVEGEPYTPARVVAEHRGGYRVQTPAAELPARVAGRLRHQATDSDDWPAVGDWVAIHAAQNSNEVTIHRVLPRRTKFSRKKAGNQTDEQVVAANIDVVWIVSSLDRDFNLRRIERYLTLTWESGASPVVVLTKSDLQDDTNRFSDEIESIAIGTPVHCTSSLTGSGLSELLTYCRNHQTVALLGSSGVGKSTLINALAGSTIQATGQVREDGKGRHTTTYRQLLRLPMGGLVIDTPGMRELQLWDGQEGLADSFVDIDEIAGSCRFSDCQHAGEPGCAVADAITTGKLSEDRLQSYQKQQRELAYLARKQDARERSQERRRIKSIMKSLRHHPKYKR